MYDFNLLENEEVKLIDDDVRIFVDSEFREYTSIITNQRLLILDYPSNLGNSMEDLRTSQRLFYIKKKIIIFEINLDNLKIENDKNNIKILLDNEKYLLIENGNTSKYLQKLIN